MAPEALPGRVVGERITALRSIFGLTQKDLAERLGVSQSFLSHIARGARPMPEVLAIEASRAYNVPVSFFMVRPTAADHGPVTFRKSSKASVREEARVVALFDEAARVFRAVSQESDYRVAKLPSPADCQGDVELAGELLRAEVGLGPMDPVLNVTRTLERLGVGVIDNLDHLSPEARGHVAVSRPLEHNPRPLVALVAELPAAVSRLTLLHELGHLIFDKQLSGPISSTRSREELRAYKFAGAFLLPEAVTRRRVSETLNLHGYLPIKADYGISVGAIIMRARDLGVISADRARSLQIQLSSQGWRYDEPVPVAQERPLLLAQALRKVYGEKVTAKAAHDLGVPPDWLLQWTHGETPVQSTPGNVIDLASARARRSVATDAI